VFARSTSDAQDRYWDGQVLHHLAMNFWNSLSGGNAAGTEDSGASGWLSSLREKGKEIAEVYKRDLGVPLPLCIFGLRIRAYTCRVLSCSQTARSLAPGVCVREVILFTDFHLVVSQRILRVVLPCIHSHPLRTCTSPTRSTAEFTSVVKKDTAVVAEEVLSKTKATVEQNFNKLPQAAPHAVRCVTAASCQSI
jgi:hypothetical protein